MKNIELCINIHEGLKEGYKLNVIFNLIEDEFPISIIEYLLTVSVAKKINDFILEKRHYQYKVGLEYSLYSFYLNCFPANKFEEGNDIFSIKYIRRVVEGLSKNQKRLDIAVIGKDNNRSYCGIELKGINPSTGSKQNDLDRLAFAFEHTSNMDDNSLNDSYFGFLYNPSNKNEITENEEISLQSLENIINTDKKIFENEHPTLELEFTHRILNKSYSDSFGDDSDYHEVAYNTGVIYSVVYKITQKTKFE